MGPSSGGAVCLIGALDVSRPYRAVGTAAGERATLETRVGRLAAMRPDVRRVLEQLSDVPVDIAARFVTAETLLP